MCHRYIQTSDMSSLQRSLAFSNALDLSPRHNIRPSQQVPVVYMLDGGNSLTTMRWGITDPSLSADLLPEYDLRRSAEDPIFDTRLQQRCLIPADGFYECEKRAASQLQPWLVTLLEDGPFCFAGIWQANAVADERPLTAYDCALLAVTDNGTIAPLANRVPVILAAQDYDAWLDPTTPMSIVTALLKPYRESGIYCHPVSAAILQTDRDTPELAEPAQLLAA